MIFRPPAPWGGLPAGPGPNGSVGASNRVKTCYPPLIRHPRKPKSGQVLDYGGGSYYGGGSGSIRYILTRDPGVPPQNHQKWHVYDTYVYSWTKLFKFFMKMEPGCIFEAPFLVTRPKNFSFGAFGAKEKSSWPGPSAGLWGGGAD